MEALAVFGIACNVLQVLGSVEQAIRLGRTIYKKRSVDPELARNIAALNTCIQGLDSSLQNSTDAATQDTKDLVFIAKECLDCGAKTKEQLQKISDLAPVGSRLGVLRAWAAAVTWGKRELDELERTMRARQHVLETQLLVRICKKSDAMTIRSRDSFESLNSTLQSFILACMQGQMTLEKIMESQSESIKDYVFVEANKTRESTKDSICEESHRIYSNISMTLQTMRTAESSKKDRERLSESLRYPSMDSRRNQIEDPQEETFKWIFKSPSHNQYRDSNVRWSDFPNWLRASNSPMPYWITGKAGSGKSTLMRYLATHERTYDMLSIKGTKITILSHYMWAAGDPLQRSVVGFLCSLLHQLLWDCDALGSLVLSHFKDARRKRVVSDWSRKDLEAVLNFLFSISRESFCLFLDGVDEAEDQTAPKIFNGTRKTYYAVQVYTLTGSLIGLS
ncbi:hypothetical protein LEL_02818 [Akanthomyces lecanii RCEF 1005]|uniref:Nephrocystin 3-like N-terminal domain-containing protein n=1 Tax=Akanthomyces lecanii RCEF 1005 TaxID=1081108 RepID=A0A162K8I7_CORDF|nr:hypothetical protein LEL_02818 [Akanthomyces lecanii RCEF 1005]